MHTLDFIFFQVSPFEKKPNIPLFPQDEVNAFPRRHYFCRWLELEICYSYHYAAIQTENFRIWQKGEK